MILTGVITSGAGQGAYFTQVDWVQQQCNEKLGFKPYPGTLNLKIVSDDIPLVTSLDQKKGIELVSPDPKFCNAKAFPVKLGSIKGAVIMPEEKVRVHAGNIIEIIAPLNIKTSLSVADGDGLTISVIDAESDE